MVCRNKNIENRSPPNAATVQDKKFDCATNDEKLYEYGTGRAEMAELVFIFLNLRLSSGH